MWICRLCHGVWTENILAPQLRREERGEEGTPWAGYGEQLQGIGTDLGNYS